MAIQNADFVGILDRRTLSTLASIYSVPSEKTLASATLSICNKSSSATAYVNIYLCPSGGSAVDANLYYYQFPVPAGNATDGYVTATVTIDHDLAEGDIIMVQSSSVVSLITSGSLLS